MEKSLAKSFDESNEEEGISLYIHLPFCEQMCTFCGCHKYITKRHDDMEMPYIHALLSEWEIYLSHFKETPHLKELHIGGGTPTFFSPERLAFFIDQLFSTVRIAEKPSFSIEGHHLSAEDLIIRKHILNLMCQFETSWEDKRLYLSNINQIIEKLDEMFSDKLIESGDNYLRITSEGRPFVRNVRMVFDKYLNHSMNQNKRIFSKTI